MNKYEERANAVLEKRKAYIEKQKNTKKIITSALSVAASFALVFSAILFLKNYSSNPVIIDKTSTSQSDNIITVPTYKGKNIYIIEESKMFREYKSCFVNPENKNNPNDVNNLFGVVDSNGVIVLKPEYYDALSAGENAFIVSNGSNKALVDSNGKIIIPFFKGEMRAISYYADGVEYVDIITVERTDGKSYLIRPDGSRISDVDYINFQFTTTTGNEIFEKNEILLARKNDTDFDILNYQGKVVLSYGSKPTIKKKLNDNLNLVIAYTYYSENSEIKGDERRSTFFGVTDNYGNVIVPCRFNEIIFAGETIAARQGADQGLEPTDILEIYDLNGNIVCESGVFNAVSLTERRKNGVGIKFTEWNDETMMSVGGVWVIDKFGNKLSDEYCKILSNEDGTFTAVDADGKEILLDDNGNKINSDNTVID